MTETGQSGGRPGLPQWVEALAGELALNPSDVDVKMVLDLARDAAHRVDRPAAPVTTFLVGLAAGRAGATPEAIAAAAAAATRATQAWAAEHPVAPPAAEG